MRVRDIIRVWALLCFLGLGMTAQAQGDSIVASLLTCSPGNKVYSLYGHTGLRMRNITQGTDFVFNYGVFDFRRPHFSWHFTLGECDYQVVGIPYEYFIDEYEQRGSSVTEQELALLKSLIPLLKERIELLSEAPDIVEFAFGDLPPYKAWEAIYPKKTDPSTVIKIPLVLFRLSTIFPKK